ncbi:hypothetical protein N9F64_00530 [bacterium]|nr:hypothetical protein [bacterium]
MGLEKLVINQITGAAKNAFKMSIVIDAMKDQVIDEVAGKIEEQVPVPLPFDTRSVIGGNVPLPADLLTPEVMQTVPEISESQRAELLTVLDNLETQLNGLIGTKNKLQGALDTLRSPITTLEKLADTLGKVIPTLKTVVTIIRNLPLPTAVPPGVGLPATVLNNFSNTLDVMKVTIDKIDGPISVVSEGVKEIVKVITPLLGKLKLLDPIFAQSQQIIIFIRALLLYGPNASQQNINEVASDVNGRSTAVLDASAGPLNSSSTGEWRLTSPVDGIGGGNGGGGNGGGGSRGGGGNGGSGNNPAPFTGDGPPDGVPPTPSSPYTDGRGYTYTFFSDDKAYSDFLLGLLTPPVVGDGLIYRGYQLIIENDPSNNFPFPSRRIKATFTLTSSDINANDASTNFALRLLGSVLYNLPDEDYSFSSSVQVLISEAYYEIDRFVEGKQSLQSVINNEYIYDSNGVAIGRIPGRLGFTYPWISYTSDGGGSGTGTVAGTSVVGDASFGSSTLAPFQGGAAIDAVNNAGNWFGHSSKFPRIFQTYIDRFPNDTYSPIVSGFNILIESGINTTIGGQFNIGSLNANNPATLSPTVGITNAGSVGSSTGAGSVGSSTGAGSGSSSGAGSTAPPESTSVPPPQGAFYPFNVAGGYPGELRNWQVPNSNPTIYQTYRYDFVTPYTLFGKYYVAKWTLISTPPSGKGG